MRIGGIASGFDTEQIVADLMRAERIPLDRIFQQKVRAEWKRDEYRSINTKLARLQDIVFNMQLRSTYDSKQAVSSNDGILSVSSSGNSQIGSYKIQVNSLATSGTLISDSVGNGFQEFVNSIEAGESTSIRMRAQGGDTEFVEIKIAANESIESLVKKINTHKELGVNAYYDEHEDRLVFTTKTTGINAKVEFDSDDQATNNFVNSVLLDSDGQWYKEQVGTNASLMINGLETQRESNTFVLNGTTVTLHAASEQIVDLNVSQDTEKTFNLIKDFIDQYNELTEEINSKLREPFHRDFPPLTDQQKEDMSDREIELWEEKSKSGMLRSDRILTGLLTTLRTSLTSAVKGLDGVSSLQQIGITTGHWSENGKLHINESKLKEAIAENSEEMIRLFTNDPSTNSGEAGVFRKLHVALGNGVKRLSETAGKASSLHDQSFLSEEIRRFDQRMDAMEERLMKVENRYWAQFIAMEQALQQMYSQSDWLSQQLMAFNN